MVLTQSHLRSSVLSQVPHHEINAKEDLVRSYGDVLSQKQHTKLGYTLLLLKTPYHTWQQCTAVKMNFVTKTDCICLEKKVHLSMVYQIKVY